MGSAQPSRAALRSDPKPEAAGCCVGLDLGTSGCRGAAVDASGRLLALARAPLPAPSRGTGGESEQAPQLWWVAVQTVLRALVADPEVPRISAVAVDGTSATLLLCTAEGEPLTPGRMYDDSRARKEAERLRSLAPPQAAVHSPTSSLAKLLHWLGRSGFADHRFLALHQADWILGRLSGLFGVTDENNALKLGYDPLARRWPDWLAPLSLPSGCLPRVLPPGRALGPVTPAAARATGLPPDTLVVSGTTDSTAATLAAGVRGPGDAVTTLGSTLVLKVLSPRPVSSPEHGVYSHRLGDLWLAGGASNSGGAVCAHFFDPQRMRELTPEIDPGRRTGLDYYPLLQPGERFPINDPDYAPRLEPRPQSDLLFFQGLLEGLAHIEERGYALLRELGAPAPRQVFSTGGGAINEPWRRMREAMLGVPILVAAQQEAAYGAALLAWQGLEESRRGINGAAELLKGD